MVVAVERLLALKLNQSEIARRLGPPRDQEAMLAAVREMLEDLWALAPQLGVRTLFELHQAWKTDARRTRLWLSGREPKTITQAEARELAGRPAAIRQVVRDPSDGSTRTVAPGSAPSLIAGANAPRVDVAAPSKLQQASSPVGTAVFEVKARGVQGTLVLDNILAPRSDVLVRLKDGTLRAVPAGDLRIVKVRPG